MSDLKYKIKKMLPPIVSCLYKERKYRNVMKIYREGQKQISKKPHESDAPRIAFVVQFPEIWNSIYSIYAQAELKKMQTLILCIPKPEVNYSSEYIPSAKNEAYDFFKEKNIMAVNAWNESDNTWFDLKGYRPDYVIYARPYNKQYPGIYQSTSVCSYAKVCYVPYAFSQTTRGLFYASFNYDFLLATYLTFPPSRIRLEDCKKRFALQRILKTNKYVYLGFPRFDLLTQSRKTEKSVSHKEKVKTIAWFPRWTVDCTEGQKPSSFFTYLEYMLEYMENHSELNLIIRPHPLMFKVILEKKIMSEDEVNNLRNKIEDLSNIYMDESKDYLPTLLNSDILISDFSSLLIEYFVTGKPIIYCDTSKDFNADAKLMDKTLYHAAEWQEIESYVNQLVEGQDINYQARQMAIKQLMPDNAGNIGAEILEYIVRDYRKT